MCDFNFKISTSEQQVYGPNVTVDGRPVVWEGTTGGLVKMGAPGANLDVETGNLTELNGIELDAHNGNVITIVPPSSPTTHTLTLPSTVGYHNTALTNDGCGALNWSFQQGDIVGPVPATDNSVPLFDGTTGKLVRDSTIISNTANDLHVQSTTGSTNKTTGSAVFGGGVGVAGDVHADTVQATTVVSGTILKVINGANDVKLARNAGGTTYSLSLPNAQGGAGQVLKNDGAGALSWGSENGMSVLDHHLFYNVFPVFDNTNVVTTPIQQGQTLNINTKYLATPGSNTSDDLLSFFLPEITNIVKDDFVLIQLDAGLAPTFEFFINTHNPATTFVEGSPIFSLATVINQNPGTGTNPYAVQIW